MNQREWQRRAETFRDSVETAAAGVTVGASLMIFIPTEVTQALGLDNARPAGVKITLFAAAVWAAFRIVRIVRK